MKQLTGDGTFNGFYVAIGEGSFPAVFALLGNAGLDFLILQNLSGDEAAGSRSGRQVL